MIDKKIAKVGIVGLGYVGLPLAVAFAAAKVKVIGFDIREKRVEAVNNGQSYIADVDSGSLTAVIGNGYLEATTDQSRLKEVEAICICVPTPLNKTKDPDLSAVINATEEVARYLQIGQLVVLESTTYPGTTKEVILPILEKSGLKAGEGFYLAYSPERVDPGTKNYTVRNTPKVVGGIDSQSTRRAEMLYCQVADMVFPVSCPEAAEMTKLFENVFRSVNIALVNELSQLCQKIGISVWEVIDAAASKPFGYMTFYPGPGIGGHCIPLDPYYLANKALEYDFHTRFIQLAAEINEQMPYYVVGRIMELLNEKGKSLSRARVLLLGVSYKRDVADIRESPVLKIIHLLCEKGVQLSYHDPYVEVIWIGGKKISCIELTDECLSASDCVVIGTDHSKYDYGDIAEKACLVFDTRGVTRHLIKQNIVRL